MSWTVPWQTGTRRLAPGAPAQREKSRPECTPSESEAVFSSPSRGRSQAVPSRPRPSPHATLNTRDAEVRPRAGSRTTTMAAGSVAFMSLDDMKAELGLSQSE